MTYFQPNFIKVSAQNFGYFPYRMSLMNHCLPLILMQIFRYVVVVDFAVLREYWPEKIGMFEAANEFKNLSK